MLSQHLTSDRKRGQRQGEQHKQPMLTSDQIQEILNNPTWRIHDEPQIVGIGHQLLIKPDDPALAELFLDQVQRKAIEAREAGDPFRVNYPVKGSVLRTADDVDLLTLATGDRLGFRLPF